ncbi:hypothetical protein C0993_008011, partial [Termitomyces sp. T159_Od127]
MFVYTYVLSQRPAKHQSLPLSPIAFRAFCPSSHCVVNSQQHAQRGSRDYRFVPSRQKPVLTIFANPPLAITCIAATSLLARQLSKIPQILRKPAVLNGRGIENLLMSILSFLPSVPTLPTLFVTSKALRQPAVNNGRGIESLSTELNDAITDALRDIEDLHNWTRASGLHWEKNDHEVIENARLELVRLQMTILACAMETAQVIPVPAEIKSTTHGKDAEEEAKEAHSKETIEVTEGVSIDIGEFFEFAEEVEDGPAKVEVATIEVAQQVQEAEVEINTVPSFKLTEVAEIEFQAGSESLKLGEEASQVEVVGQFSTLAE